MSPQQISGLSTFLARARITSTSEGIPSTSGPRASLVGYASSESDSSRESVWLVFLSFDCVDTNVSAVPELPTAGVAQDPIMDETPVVEESPAMEEGSAAGASPESPRSDGVSETSEISGTDTCVFSSVSIEFRSISSDNCSGQREKTSFDSFG